MDLNGIFAIKINGEVVYKNNFLKTNTKKDAISKYPTNYKTITSNNK
ncbi:hypothetical protein [Clostridium rectalis]|nr:hypothetical protein [Clostridium rectalis]